MDIEEFLVEARKGQVSMLFLNAEEDEDTDGMVIIKRILCHWLRVQTRAILLN